MRAKTGCNLVGGGGACWQISQKIKKERGHPKENPQQFKKRSKTENKRQENSLLAKKLLYRVF